MSKDQYLEMIEQLGEEPDWDKCPPDWEDFPDLVITAINIYHSMGDKIYPEIGYIGKDYGNYDFLLKLYGIEEYNKDFLNEIILHMDSRAIEISQKKLKAEYDKMKRKSG
tara:strand:- start:362 stop:691 length:330 start_codon:yes stop_codon:yes gene_type:complete